MSSSGPKTRLAKIAAHLLPGSAQPPVSGVPTDNLVIDGRKMGTLNWFNIHTLSPCFFLPRAASIEPNGPAVYHRTANNKIIRRTYQEFADRARGFAYYCRKKELKRVGILCTNTPGFLEAFFGSNAAGGIHIAINYRLKADDIGYIFDHADADSIVVDAEFEYLLDDYRKQHPNVPIIVDTDTDILDGDQAGPLARAVLEGLQYDVETGSKGWADLESQAPNELSVNALAYTSGTTARPKGVEYTHRGCYMAAMGNVIDSGLSYHGTDRARYLWTLPMFHATGWTFPWSVTAARGTHYCLRKIDYPEIWRLLKEEKITHYCAAPTVNTLLLADKNAEKLESPVRVTVAASPPSAHLFETMENYNLHPVHVYGLTETYGPITKGYHMLDWSDLPTKERYAKMARQGHGFVTSLPCRVVKPELAEEGTIVDVAKDGKEIGEIVFEGNICARGYYKDIAATQKLFKGGVLHSGDLAVWWPDGAVHILDRAKDIIISGGENISSVSLESIIVTHPDILECGVAAIQHERWGESPKAFITVKSGKRLTGDAVIKWCKEHPQMSRFMVPSEIEVVPELPKTSTGKIRKNVLRDWAKGKPREQGAE